MQTLTGHTTKQTAYVVADYPYGFKLRCSIRYWVESNAKGHRLWSQTSNPKKGGAWNKPKCSTYADIGAAMYLDDEGHVQWEGLTFSASAAEIASFFERFPGAVTDVVQALALRIEKLEAKYEGKEQVIAV